ncbi:uncharacterized protein LOC121422331 isoform X2 [Lytechinus variegatus]|uniref:uncharacterized protein LOC121422331 isoform X2 n=1 Tax=Lytechinus variegatus TaxID=7654 RepID=UPI001BB14713|nr:uncharacterized protein LOC121422331 isoform X2 [Lytechinus variegatus]
MPKRRQGLILYDTISVKSQSGDCNIQLCFGDITKLKQEDKVDVIFVSSFGNNYDKMPGTVIGALYENLGIDVRKLADDKEEDLRSLYSCWWSKPLPSKIPYNRLLCFESRRRRAGRPQELVGHAFRCLVPILKNKDASVITPLLSTGNQGYDPRVMLEGMIQAAISWVKAGLPIRLLKIVVYATIKDDGEINFLRGADRDILDKFEELKSRYESANLIPQEVTLEYDVYLSFSDKDQEIADKIQAQLLEEKPDIRIFTARQKVDTEVFWQEQMYEWVSKSARVVTGHEWQRTLYHSIDGSSCMIALISPKYLRSAVCMEEYSLAQVKHLSQDPLHLIPVCICDGIEEDFAKISHIPMLDARPGAYDDAVNSICSAVVSWLDTSSFLHLDTLLTKNPDNQVNIPDMMEKLRAARFWAEYRKTIISVKIFPPTMDKLTDDEDRTTAKEICEDAEGEKKNNKEEEMKEDTCIEGGLDGKEEARNICKDLQGLEVKDGKKDTVKDEENEALPDEQEKTLVNVGVAEKADMAVKSALTHSGAGSATKSEKTSKSETVVISYHQTDIKFVHFLKELFKTYVPNLVLKSEFETEQMRLDSLEEADAIIALLSPQYIESPQHVEEFHIGLWRQRVSPEEAPLLVPVQVALLPKRPTYFQLVGYPVNTWDAMWADLLGIQDIRSPEGIDKIRHDIGKANLPKVSPDELHPLTEAAQVVISSIKSRRNITVEDPPRVRPALVNTVKLQNELATLKEDSECTSVLDQYLVSVPIYEGEASPSKTCTIL